LLGYSVILTLEVEGVGSSDDGPSPWTITLPAQSKVLQTAQTPLQNVMLHGSTGGAKANEARMSSNGTPGAKSANTDGSGVGINR
jgi:hypothetical protein